MSKPLHDFRRHPPEEGPLGYDNPVFFAVGILFLIVFAFLTFYSLFILIPVALLLIPTIIRTFRLAFRPVAHEARSIWGFLFCSLLASVGIVALAGTASAIALFVVYLTIPGGNSISSPLSVYVWSLTAGSVVFLAIFIPLWPRERSGGSAHRSPDPEE